MSFIASTLQQVGISVSKSVGISGFLTGLYTIFVPIACYVFFKKKTGFNVVISAVLAVIGIFMLCSVRQCVCMPLGSIMQYLVIKSIHLALSFFRLYHCIY